MQQEMESEQRKEDLLQMRLSDTEKGWLFNFCQNEGMVKAVEKAMLYTLYEMGNVQKADDDNNTINWAISISNANLTDEEKGKALTTLANGLGALQDAFRQIKKFGVEKVEEGKEKNPAV